MHNSSSSSGPTFGADATLDPRAAQRLSGPELRAIASENSARAIVARAELDRRDARRQGVSYTDSRAIVTAALAQPTPTLSVVGGTEPRPPAPPTETKASAPNERDERTDDTGTWHITGTEPGMPGHGRSYSYPAALLGVAHLRTQHPAGSFDVAPGPHPSIEGAATARAAVLAPPEIRELPTSPRPVPSFTWTDKSSGWGAGENVNAETKARAHADADYLRSLGFAPAPTAVQEGALLITEGQRTLVRSYQDHHDQPRTIDACEEIRRRVGDERRIDIETTGRIMMGPDGRLTVSGWGDALAIEQGTLPDLVVRNKRLPRAAALMEILPAPVRADVWNAQHDPETDRIVLRTRVGQDGEGPRAVFGVVSPGYGKLDADEIARLVAHALRSVPGGDTARGPIDYNPADATVRIDAIWHVDHTVNFGAGDVFKVGASVRSNDTGGGAIVVSFGYWRNLCLNMGILDVRSMPAVRIVHRGETADLGVRLVRGLRTVLGYAQPFVTRWSGLRAQPVADVIENASASAETNVRAVFSALAGIENETLPLLRPGALPEGVSVDGIARDALVESLLSGWKSEPGDSLADVVNAVTRLHTARVPVPVLRSAERAASDLFGHWTA